MQYDLAIQEIIRLKEAFDKIGIDRNTKIPKKLAGDLGELYVLYELQNMGFENIIHKGGQSGYDIHLKYNNIRIEVKTSFPKNDGIYPKEPYNIQFYGWTALRVKQVMPPYDILIGIALDESFKNPKFYIFTSDEVNRIGKVELKRYRAIKKKIHLFIDEKSYTGAVNSQPNLVTEFEKYINRNPTEFCNRWDKIKLMAR